MSPIENQITKQEFCTKFRCLVDAHTACHDTTDEQVLQQFTLADELSDVLYDYASHYRDIGYKRGFRIDRVNDIPTIARNEGRTPDSGPGYWMWGGDFGSLGTDIDVFWGAQAGLGVNVHWTKRCVDFHFYLPGCMIRVCLYRKAD